MAEVSRPKVGVAALIFKDGKVLLGKRCGNAGGDGLYGGPGGHVEHLEDLCDAVKRECLEETGIFIENLSFVCVVNVREFAPLHHVMVVFKADWKSGEPQALELDRCEHWGWYAPDALPGKVTPATGNGLIALTSSQAVFP